MCIANSKTRLSQLLNSAVSVYSSRFSRSRLEFWKKEDLEIIQTFLNCLNLQNSVRMNYSIYFSKKRQDKIVIWELTNCGFQCNYPAASPASPLFHSFAMLTSWQSLQLKIMSSFILMSLKILSLSSICHCFVKNQK